MGKSKYKVYNGKIIKEMLENSRIFILIFLFAAGIIFGASAIRKDTFIVEKIKDLISSFAMLRAGQGVAENFCNSLSVNLMFSAVSVFLGFSLIGYPFILCMPFLRGVAMGAVSGYLYLEYKFTGIGYSFLIIYPGAIVSMIALMLIFNNSCEYSKNAYSKAIQGRGQFEKDETRYFLIRQLMFTAVSSVGSLIDALSVELFSAFFNL